MGANASAPGATVVGDAVVADLVAAEAAAAVASLTFFFDMVSLFSSFVVVPPETHVSDVGDGPEVRAPGQSRRVVVSRGDRARSARAENTLPHVSPEDDPQHANDRREHNRADHVRTPHSWRIVGGG